MTWKFNPVEISLQWIKDVEQLLVGDVLLDFGLLGDGIDFDGGNRYNATAIIDQGNRLNGNI